MTKTLDDYREEFHRCETDVQIRDFLYRSYAAIYAHVTGESFNSSISVQMRGTPQQKMYFNIEAHRALDVLRTFSPDMFDRVSGGGWNTSAHIEHAFTPTGGYIPTTIDVSRHMDAMNAAASWDVWWQAWLDGLQDFAVQRLGVAASPDWLNDVMADIHAWVSTSKILDEFPRIQPYRVTSLAFSSGFSSIEPVFHFSNRWRVLFEDNPLVNMVSNRSRMGYFCAEPQPYWETLKTQIDRCIETHRNVMGVTPAVYQLFGYYRRAQEPGLDAFELNAP